MKSVLRLVENQRYRFSDRFFCELVITLLFSVLLSERTVSDTQILYQSKGEPIYLGGSTPIKNTTELSTKFLSWLTHCPVKIRGKTNFKGNWFCLYDYALSHLKKGQCLSVLYKEPLTGSCKEKHDFLVYPLRIMDGLSDGEDGKDEYLLHLNKRAAQLNNSSGTLLLGLYPSTEIEELHMPTFFPLGTMCRPNDTGTVSPLQFGALAVINKLINNGEIDVRYIIRDLLGNPDSFHQMYETRKECPISPENKKLKIANPTINNVFLKKKIPIATIKHEKHADLPLLSMQSQWFELYRTLVTELKDKQCVAVFYQFTSDKTQAFFWTPPLWGKESSGFKDIEVNINGKTLCDTTTDCSSGLAPVGRMCRHISDNTQPPMSFDCLNVNGMTTFEFEKSIGDLDAFYEEYKHEEIRRKDGIRKYHPDH